MTPEVCASVLLGSCFVRSRREAGCSTSLAAAEYFFCATGCKQGYFLNLRVFFCPACEFLYLCVKFSANGTKIQLSLSCRGSGQTQSLPHAGTSTTMYTRTRRFCSATAVPWSSVNACRPCSMPPWASRCTPSGSRPVRRRTSSSNTSMQSRSNLLQR